jgi:hypothetical protein
MMFGRYESGEYKNVGKGILEMSNNLKCPICLEIKEYISQPICNHSLCISCFKRCYYGDEILMENLFFHISILKMNIMMTQKI